MTKLRLDQTRCPQCPGKACGSKIVFGEGPDDAVLMVVGETPGFYEDQQGVPFVGKPGQLLRKIIVAARIKKSEVFMTNAVSCRSPENAQPTPVQIESCAPKLRAKIAVVKPRLIVCVGAIAARSLLNIKKELKVMRQEEYSYNGIPVLVTTHPSRLLHRPSEKEGAFRDWVAIRKRLRAVV